MAVDKCGRDERRCRRQPVTRVLPDRLLEQGHAMFANFRSLTWHELLRRTIAEALADDYPGMAAQLWPSGAARVQGDVQNFRAYTAVHGASAPSSC